MCSVQRPILIAFFGDSGKIPLNMKDAIPGAAMRLCPSEADGDGDPFLSITQAPASSEGHLQFFRKFIVSDELVCMREPSSPRAANDGAMGGNIVTSIFHHHGCPHRPV